MRKYNYYSEKTWGRELDRAIKRQKRLAIRIVKMETIIKMKKKNRFTLEQIGKKVGFTREYVRQLISFFRLE